MERELDALGLDEQTRSTLDKMDEERSSWSFKGWLMKGLAYILELAFAAAAIVIDALRTFYLVVFPELKVPRVTIQTEAPGLTAEEVEQYITIPIESAMNGTRCV